MSRACRRKMALLCIVLIFLCRQCSHAQHGGEKSDESLRPNYSNFKLVRIVPKTQGEVEYLHALFRTSNTEDGLDFWQPPSIKWAAVDVAVSPKINANFFAHLRAHHLENYVVIEDLERAIKEEVSHPIVSFDTPANATRQFVEPFVYHYDRYNPLSTIYSQLHHIRRDNPRIVSLIELGRSHENRSILALKITTKGNDKDRPIMWIDAGIHAREWIAPATGMYFINRLLEGYNSKEEAIRAMVQNMVFYIAPVLNPDGYEYTHTTNRLWRKNRKPGQCKKRQGKACCMGVDLNRNFDWYWASTGSSNDQCSETYHGESPFSEPESMALREWLKDHPVKAYITLHSYSQLWLTPYGHKKKTYPDDYETVVKPLASRAVEELSLLFHTRYTVGSGADILYEASGSSHDYAKGTLKVPFSYLIELRPQNSFDSKGFLLPEREINATGEETWAAIKVVAEEVLTKYGRPTIKPVKLSSLSTTQPLADLRTPELNLGDRTSRASSFYFRWESNKVYRQIPRPYSKTTVGNFSTPSSARWMSPSRVRNGTLPWNTATTAAMGAQLSSYASSPSSTPPPEPAQTSPYVPAIKAPKKTIKCRDNGSYCKRWKIHQLCERPRVRQLCSLSCLPECQI